MTEDKPQTASEVLNKSLDKLDQFVVGEDSNTIV